MIVMKKKNVTESFNDRLDQAEESACEFKDKAFEITQRRKKNKKE